MKKIITCLLFAVLVAYTYAQSPCKEEIKYLDATFKKDKDDLDNWYKSQKDLLQNDYEKTKNRMGVQQGNSRF